MTPRQLFVLLLTLLGGQPLAHAQGPWILFDGCRWSFPNLCAEWRERKCWCPDDYCWKSLPCTPPNEKGCVDDYCRKPLPCGLPNAQGCVDDYCPKTCPIMLGNLCEPWYRCVPAGNPHGHVCPAGVTQP
jgi:hypothetical protein